MELIEEHRRDLERVREKWKVDMIKIHCIHLGNSHKIYTKLQK